MCNILWTEQIVFMYLVIIHKHTYVATVNEKEAVNLREHKRVHGTSRRAGRGEGKQWIIISK